MDDLNAMRIIGYIIYIAIAIYLWRLWWKNS